jgi:hypothetical protein
MRLTENECESFRALAASWFRREENAVRATRGYLATLDDGAFGAASPVTLEKIGAVTVGLTRKTA